jgi:hypothetical protein
MRFQAQKAHEANRTPGHLPGLIPKTGRAVAPLPHRAGAALRVIPAGRRSQPVPAHLHRRARVARPAGLPAPRTTAMRPSTRTTSKNDKTGSTTQDMTRAADPPPGPATPDQNPGRHLTRHPRHHTPGTGNASRTRSRRRTHQRPQRIGTTRRRRPVTYVGGAPDLPDCGSL